MIDTDYGRTMFAVKVIDGLLDIKTSILASASTGGDKEAAKKAFSEVHEAAKSALKVIAGDTPELLNEAAFAKDVNIEFEDGWAHAKGLLDTPRFGGLPIQ